MKKYLILIAGISLLFFSCASTPENENSEAQSQITPDSSSVIADAEASDTAEDNVQNSAEDNLTEQDELENEDYQEELEWLSDPEVTDLEYVEQAEVENPDSEEKTEPEDTSFELVPQEDAAPEEITAVELSAAAPPSQETTVSDSTTDYTPETENNTVNNKTGTNAANSQNEDEIIDLTQNNSPEDIIEILDEDSDSTPMEAEPEIIIPSRKVTLKIGQTLEVMYPGSGWIYMGTTDSTKDFTFLGKKLGTQNTKFTFTAKAEGTKILHFYKNDALTGNYIDDYLEVEITSQKDTTKATVSAPAYKNPVPVKETASKKINVTSKSEETTANNNTSKSVAASEKSTYSDKTSNLETTAIAASSSTTNNNAALDKTASTENTNTADAEEISPVLSEAQIADLLKQAHNLYDSKDYKAALEKLSQFFEYSTKNRDEAYFLQGQIYESESSTKNIKLAIDAYKNVINNYPASPYWDDANKRIIYLTKFYLEGR